MKRRFSRAAATENGRDSGRSEVSGWNRKKIGDQVTFESGTDTALSDDLSQETFTIVGSATLPYYMDLTRGTEVSETAASTVLGCCFRRHLPVRFIQKSMCRWMEQKNWKVTVPLMKKTVKQVQNRVEELEEEACQRRYDTVYQEGEEKLSDARKQVADGEKELADGKRRWKTALLRSKRRKIPSLRRKKN